MKPVIQRIIVAGIVAYKDKALIIQRASDDDVFPNLWELPSGKREFFEASVEAVKREVKEETGIEIEPAMPVSVFEFKVEKESETRDSTQISFLAKPIGVPKVMLSNEHQNFAWISESEIDNYKISKETKEVISKAFKILKQNV